MKRLIFLAASLGLGIVAIALAIRWGLPSVPAYADEPPPSPTLAERLTQAEALSTQNKWEEALTVLREVVSRKAEDPALAAEAQCRLGRYRLLMALPKEAEEELRAVASQFPDQTEKVNWSRFFLIDALAFQHNEEGALEVARALVSDQTVTGLQKAWASVRLGGLLSSRGQWGEAIAVLEEVPSIPLSDQGPALQASIALGRLLTDLAMPARAIQYLEFVVAHPSATDRDRNWARVNLMQAYRYAQQTDKVPPLVEAVIADGDAGKADNEQVANALLWSGRLSEDQASLAEQDEDIEEADRLLEFAGQQYAAAAEKGLGLTVGIRALLNMADLRMRQYEYTDALAQATEAAERGKKIGDNAQTAQAQVKQGNALAQLDRLAEAEEQYLQALVVLPGSPALAYDVDCALGDLALKRGDRAAAATYFKDAHAQAMFANLRGYPLERVRTQIARLAEREGKLDTAIAWYRLAITSPGTLPGNESQMADEVARLYRRANRPAEEEAWRVYLLDPRTAPDPTEPITVAVLGAAPQNVIAESVAGGSDRLATLGKFYMSQRRLPEAQGQFEQALQAAANEKQQAEALTGLAYCQRRLQGGAVALTTADQAVQHWLNVVETSSLDGDAHYAIEMAAATYAGNAFSEKALSLLLQLKDSLSAEHSASRACFVRYRLVQEYICQGRGSDAKSMAEETLATFLDRPFRQGHSTLCGYTMVHLARLKARDGDLSGAQGLLDQLGQRWPLQFGAELAEYRESILQTALPPAQ